MAPAKTAGRSRRTQSYTWTSDSNALRPVHQLPDHPESTKTTTQAVTGLHEPCDEPRVDKVAAVRAASRPSTFKPKMNYDSDSCLTPRSRRTLRRTVSGVTEPWPSVTTPATAPALETIYSPTHEILHPMQSLLLEKSQSTDPAITKQLSTVSFVTVRTTTKGTHFTPTRMTQSVDFDSSLELSVDQPKRSEPNALKLESYVFPEARDEEDDASQLQDREDATERTENQGSEAPLSKNIVVIIVDAEKNPGSKFVALDWAINVAVHPGDEIVILGVLKHVSSPFGYKVVANTDPEVGVNPKLLQSEVHKITELFEQKLSDSGRRAECEKKNVKLTVRISPGARARTVVVQELAALNATYAVFDRRVMRGTRYYNKHLSCHAVRMRSNGRSIKTIFTMSTQKNNNNNKVLANSLPSSSGSPTSDTGSSSSAPSPTYFWRRFTAFKSNRSGNKWSPGKNSSSMSPRSSTASSETVASHTPSADSSLNLDSFMSEMQDFSISLDSGTNQRSKLALQSCVAADAFAFKQGMDSRGRIKHRPISVTIPPICAT